ncbi:hypothetical protein [Sphaerisporangium rubeum]|uniref:Transposase n=1 Tax=Sphaerisporangium rubeum TaxID=321317 RepID=A0A7X0M5V3_9ACTN|nr:hypothetical protein [Sphaerisporangium rubeum]MBB6472577.1 transposase [Sphaerisporangium rubeum]
MEHTRVSIDPARFGHVNRVKALKRQMYGRANPGRLRKRVLLAD